MFEADRATGERSDFVCRLIQFDCLSRSSTGLAWPQAPEDAEARIAAFIRPDEQDGGKPPSLSGCENRVRGWAADLHAALHLAEAGDAASLPATTDRIIGELTAAERDLVRFFADPPELAERVRSFSALSMMRRAVAHTE